MKIKIGIHDRDGHLICPYPDDVPGYEQLTIFERHAPWFIKSPERQMILPGVDELLAKFNLNFVVSNQKLRNKTNSDIIKEGQWLMQRLPIKAFTFSPDNGQTGYLLVNNQVHQLHIIYPDLIGQFRKPNIGCIIALKHWFYTDFQNAYMLYGFGDRLSDKQCFENAGCIFEWSDIARNHLDPLSREMS